MDETRDSFTAPDRTAPVRGAAEQRAAGRGAILSELEFTVVDVETTGWAPDEASITEIGAVRVRAGRLVAEFSSLVNPGMPVPATITELTGISDQMLISAPPVAGVLPGLLAFARGSVLAAHNAPFDLRFLTAACTGMGLDWPSFEVLDTVRLARHLMATPEEVPDRKLATLARFFATPVRPSHRALDDARSTAAILGRLLARLADREGVSTLGQLDTWLAARDAEVAAAEVAAAEVAAAEVAAAEVAAAEAAAVEGAATAGQEADADGRETARADAGIG